MSRYLALALAGGLVLAGGVWRISAHTNEVGPARPAGTPSPQPAAALTPIPVRALRTRGRLDQTFAGDGRATTDFDGNPNGAEAVALGPAGTIVVAGWSSTTSEYQPEAFAVSRYLPDGSLDPGFGDGGRVTTDFGVTQGATNGAHAVLVGDDGRITAVGEAGATFHNEGFAVARYLPDGSPDPSFGGGDGLVIVRKEGELEDCAVARAVAPAPDGKLVLAGSTGCGGESDGGVAVAVVRLTADGAMDTSFAHDGLRVFDFGPCGYATAVAHQANGKIVIGGSDGGCYEEHSPFRVARLNPDGSTDTGFGHRGRARVDFARDQTGALDLTVDGQDRILMAGAANDRFALARLTPEGRPDLKVLSSIASRPALPASIVPTARGGFVVGGTVFTRKGDADHGVIGIYDSRGTLTRAISLKQDEINALAIDGEGRLLAAGAADADFAIARLD